MAGPDAEYRDHLAAGRFMLQRGQGGTFHYPPRAVVPGDGSEALEWVEASGRGTVYSATTIYNRAPEPDRNIALIDLAEGPRMMSRVEGIEPALVRIGMTVQARIFDQDGSPIVVFTVKDVRD
jgi:uncharacterized OB-fold protein